MNVKERLKRFIAYKKISVRKFENITGLSHGYVNNMRVSMQPDKMENIAKCFPELNTGWLMTGEGEMLKNTPYEMSEKESIVATPQASYGVDYLEVLEEKNKQIDKLNNTIDRLSRIIENLSSTIKELSTKDNKNFTEGSSKPA